MFFRCLFFVGLVSLIAACGALSSAIEGDDKCCPRDGTTSGSMRLGGPTENGCFVTHDFWCSTNWRVETDEHGCEVWRSDIRRPGPGEDDHCMRRPQPTKEDRCCPRDPFLQGCMNLGGRKTASTACMPACDFFCSENWRIVDDDGCEAWSYDVREPRADETATCSPRPDAGDAGDASVSD